MEHETYLEILAQHGRRVANRVALADINANGGHKELSDFYSCYGLEDDLPESEKSKTDLISKFDPTGWFDHYASPITSMWPEPKHEPESNQ